MQLVHQASNILDKDAKFKEIRRQRWNYLFENHTNVENVKNIIFGISEAGIRYTDFSARIARAYELLTNQLKVERIDEVTQLETLPDFNQTIVGDPKIDACLNILMKDYETRESPYWLD